MARERHLLTPRGVMLGLNEQEIRRDLVLRPGAAPRAVPRVRRLRALSRFVNCHDNTRNQGRNWRCSPWLEQVQLPPLLVKGLSEEGNPDRDKMVTLRPQPLTLNPPPSTLNPQPSTLTPQP